MGDSLDQSSLVILPGSLGWELGGRASAQSCVPQGSPPAPHKCWALEESQPWSAVADPLPFVPASYPGRGLELPSWGPAGERHTGLMVIRTEVWPTGDEPQKCAADPRDVSLLRRIAFSRRFLCIHPSWWPPDLGRPCWRREARSKDSTFLRTENSWALGKERADGFLEFRLKPGFAFSCVCSCART